MQTDLTAREWPIRVNFSFFVSKFQTFTEQSSEQVTIYFPFNEIAIPYTGPV